MGNNLKKMRILAIDTSCDETAAAVTENTKVLSNIIWSQASAHAKFGGVMPSLAQRMHEERIDWVINKAIRDSGLLWINIQAIAVTQGPGLAIALGVGINKAKQLAEQYRLPILPINHIEGHLLSAMAAGKKTKDRPEKVTFPAFGLVISGGHTELVLMEHIGKYRIIAKTSDDALGEALDKAARMLGLGYPGGAVLEGMAELGDAKKFNLPLPMSRRENAGIWSYSGLKTAFYRMIEGMDLEKNNDKKQIYDLAASFQNRAFQHLTRICESQCEREMSNYPIRHLLVGGGVAANMELRRRLRQMANRLGLKVSFPYSKKLVGDNAAMIGVAADMNCDMGNHDLTVVQNVDRKPRWNIEELK